MSNLMQMVENEQTSEFYPTPKNIVDKMLTGANWNYINTILEPSAGKGDILREIAKKEHNMYNTFLMLIVLRLTRIYDKF